MRNKETGEFELVVGNGQLVSGFFIVILLFAVGVAMGYILGQNSEKSAKSQQTDATPCVATDVRPQPAQPVSQPAAPAADTPPATASGTPPQQPAPTTQPAKDPEAPKPEAAKQPATPPANNAASASDPPSGFFWQVAASANLEAVRATVKTLKDRGFSAYLAPGRNNLTRVLVGPFSGTQSKAKAKTELEAMSFKPVPLNRE